jgi:hypothetical protein
MTKRMSKLPKKILLIFVLISVSSCVPWFSSNRFERNSIRYSFSLGLAGYNDAGFCMKHNPKFTGKYENGTRQSRICIDYQYYTCHINHYCNGDKDCEKDAAWWLPVWQGTENDLVKRVEFTKESCEIKAKKNSSTAK